MTELSKILICDDDKLFHATIKFHLRKTYKVTSAYHGDEALILIPKQCFQVVFLDIQMRTRNEGLDYIKKFREIDPDIAIIMVSGIQDFSIVKEALRLGADDYVIKGEEIDNFSLALERVLEKKNLVRRAQLQDKEVSRSQNKNIMIGESPQIQMLRRQIAKAKSAQAHILISGETGTGKEVVARLLRQTLLDGSLAPFVAVDSATIQSSMAESLLFGYEKGAFTGADRMTRGLFEEAHGGSIYFDEMANMPLAIQNKLLRVIQEKEVMRLGASRVIPLNFRVISATNRDLNQMVTQGQFKEDLLHRINVIPLSIPPLRERKEDIPLLIDHFVYTSSGGQRCLRFSEDAMSLLMSYSWPGNIRELSNMILFLVSMAENDEIRASDLPSKFRDGVNQSTEPARPQGFNEQIENLERTLLTEAYTRYKGNVSHVAVHLGLDRSHLYQKLKKYLIHKTPPRGSGVPAEFSSKGT
jgi:two-component system response regulator AtoC